MDSLAHDYPDVFIKEHNTPCISLYQPTHRSHPKNATDPILFKNLLKKLEKSLKEKYPDNQVKELMEKFYGLEQNFSFWQHMDQGLAIFATPDFFKIYKLPRTVNEILVVADSLHIKPLIRMMQSADRFQVLALDREKIKLYEGNRDELQEIKLGSDVPHTLEEALGEEVTDPRLTVARYGSGTSGSLNRQAGNKSKPTTFGNITNNPAMHHGHGGKKDELDLDEERFFKIIDEAILKHHSHHSKLPLILAALPEYHHRFHRLSNNPYLMAEGIQVNPDGLSTEKLRQKAWDLLEPIYLNRLKGFLEHFEEARSKQLGSDDLNEIAQAVIAGRVATLLIDAECQIAGQIDQTSGQIKKGELDNPEIDDVLDDISELVLKNKGEVIVVPSEKMPTGSGAAAIYRF